MKGPDRKQRLDLALAELRPDLSRSRIQAEIMAGKVYINGLLSDKPGNMVDSKAEIKLLESENPYVSRGGLKIEGALVDLALDVKGLIILDVGASTGGFSDCLLKKGASQVYALDVGYGQLDLSLRNDPRVVVMERFNVRNLEEKDLPSKPEMAVIDVSFISLAKVIPVMAKLQIPLVLSLVKPQFEAGKAESSRGKGVIRDPALHRRILKDTIENAVNSGYHFKAATYSKLPGPKGNIEYFILFEAVESNHWPGHAKISCRIDEIVEKARIDLSAVPGADPDKKK